MNARVTTDSESGVGRFEEATAEGQVIGPLVVGTIAHGGHCIARYEGRVVFVRHAIPGETVMVRITDAQHDRYWRGDAVEIIEAAPGRVSPPCPLAGKCGGCDFQHIALETQRGLKTTVVRELLHHFAQLDSDVIVEPVGDDDTGLGWRTRMRYGVDDHTVGLHRHRSSELVALAPEGCLIAEQAGRDPQRLEALALQTDSDELIVATAPSGVSVVEAGRSSKGHPALVDERALSGEAIVTEQVGGHSFRARADGFWQPHRMAPDVLTAQVLRVLAPRPGERALDLYCGVGVFAAALTDAGCRVRGIEMNGPAIHLARANVPGAQFIAGRVDRVLARGRNKADLVVLDPPRAGAGKGAVEQIARLRPRKVAYVACDPAALARDLASFARHHYRVSDIKAFDLFPMTHHVECVALLEPDE